MQSTDKPTPEEGSANSTASLDNKVEKTSVEVHRFDGEVIPAPFVTKGAGPYAQVGLSAGRTIGLPNFSSARYDVSVVLPSDVDKVAETYEYARKFCTRRGKQLREALMGVAEPQQNKKD